MNFIDGNTVAQGHIESDRLDIICRLCCSYLRITERLNGCMMLAAEVPAPFRRRFSKTIYGVTTGYLYDDSNVVQELSGSNPSDNMLSGGLGEVFARTERGQNTQCGFRVVWM